MNIHAVVDRLTARAGALAAGKQKFFSESIESPTLIENIPQIDLEVPDITGEGIYQAGVKNPPGDLDPAFMVYRWLGPGHPVILFHHGNNENPFDFGRFAKHSFRMIFEPARDTIEASVIALRAPFHGKSLKEYTSRIAYLSEFTAMLAASVVMAEGLVSRFRDMSVPKIMVSGISLGGWVTNLHRSCFNTADRYVPLFAGAALAEVFLTSSYRILAGKAAHENPGAVRNVLNFEDAFMQVTEGNVFTLLARYDQFVTYERQKECYGNVHPVNTIDKGHVTGLLAAPDLLSHIQNVLPH